MDALAAMPCICCEIKGRPQPFKTEIHHLTTNGYRRLSGGHESTIPLCSFHHRGACLEGFTATEMADFYGPSLALQKKAFVQEIGTERELLAKVNENLDRHHRRAG